MLGKLDMWQRNTWEVTTQISTKHNITEFYVAFTNRLIVIVIIAIITELTFVGFSNYFSLGTREMLNLSTPSSSLKEEDKVFPTLTLINLSDKNDLIKRIMLPLTCMFCSC